MTPSSTKSVWQVDNALALLNDGQLSATIDLKQPSFGLGNAALNGQRLAGCNPLQVSPEPPAPNSGETLIDCYARGRDLVAAYAQTPPRTVQPTYYWRSLESPGIVAGIELIISMQTSLLDSDPTLTAHTVCRGEVFWLSERAGNAYKIIEEFWESPAETNGFFLFRLSGQISYVEMVFPSDFLGARVEKRHGEHHLTYRMFPEELEKGVIRRGRIRALFLPSERDVTAAWTAYEQLSREEPPLTT